MKSVVSVSAAAALLLASSSCMRQAMSTGVPISLQEIEAAAEDAYDKALASDSASFAAAASTIDATWQSFRPTAQSDGASAAELAALDQAIVDLLELPLGSSDVVARARAANAVSATMDELFALYSPAIPPALLALDYLGREVFLDAQESDFTAAQSDLSELQLTWESIRADVTSRGGGEAASYDASIAAVQDAITGLDAAALEAAANDGLELVDSIETLY